MVTNYKLQGYVIPRMIHSGMDKYMNIYNVFVGSSQVSILTIKGYDERLRVVAASNRSSITIKNYPRLYWDSLLVATDLIIEIIENEQD